MGRKQIIFYSWQSDLPNSCNRGFIQQALENVASTIRSDKSVEVEPVVDRDTQGVPGAPDIASTIFAKIAAADIFVADVSITGKDKKRSTPNPNVLIELGYALKALGPERVLLVFNSAMGKIEELPFDLRMRRVLSYEMLEEADRRSPERKNLEKQLETAIRAALVTIPASTESPLIAAVQAIESQQPNRIIILRRNLEEILQKLDSLQPKKYSEGGTVEELIAALNLTQEIVAEFSKIAEVVAIMSDMAAALEVQHWFGRIFERYDRPANFSGRYTEWNWDYFKFLGHELYVTFIGFILREQHYEMLEKVLAEPIPMRYLRSESGPGSVDWNYASEHIASLKEEGSRRQRMSLHADLLNERHSKGGLTEIMPMEDFIAADYFLFLLGELTPDETPGSFFAWYPWSTLYLAQVPLFLRNAEYKRAAEQLIKLFRIDSVEEFRNRLKERTPRLTLMFSGGIWRGPSVAKDADRIGMR